MLEKPIINQPPFDTIKNALDEIAKKDETLQLGFNYEKITQTDAFKKWFQGSKAVDDNGKPLLMHNATFIEPGSDSSINFKKKFQNEYLATNGSDRGRGALGAYFTSSQASIDEIREMNEGPYQEIVVHAFLKLKNPLYVPKGEDIDHMLNRMFPGSEEVSYQELKNKLQKMGYDGIIQGHRFGYYDDEYVAFNQDQILMLPNQINPELDLELKREIESKHIKPDDSEGAP